MSMSFSPFNHLARSDLSKCSDYTSAVKPTGYSCLHVNPSLEPANIQTGKVNP